MIKRLWLSVICLSLSTAQTPAYAREVVGWLESATINSAGLKVVAKLDTGAKTTSLGYSTIHFFQRDGRQWVSNGQKAKDSGAGEKSDPYSGYQTTWW